MPTYLVRWPNDEIVVTTADSKRDVYEMLDEIEDPSSCHITQLHQHVALSFKADVKKVVRRKDDIDAEKRLGAGLLGDDLGAAWKAGTLDCTADLRIRIEPAGAVACEFLVHKTILAARCGYFQTFFSQQESFASLVRSEADGIQILKMEDTDSDTFELFLHLLYTDQMPTVFDDACTRGRGNAADTVPKTQQAVRLLLLADFLMATSLKRSLLSVTASCISEMVVLCLTGHRATTNDEVRIAAAEVLVHAANALNALADVDQLVSCAIEKLADICEEPKLKEVAVFDSLSDCVSEKLEAARSQRASVDFVEVSMPHASHASGGFTGVIDALVHPTVLSQWREANGGLDQNGGQDPDPFAPSPPLQAATREAVATRQATAAAAKRASELAATNAAVSEERVSAARTKKEEGNAAFKRKQFQQAVDSYTDAIDLDPHQAEYHSNRSLVYDKQARFSEALEDAETAIKVDPYFAKGYVRKATALDHMGQNRAAVVALVTGFDSFPQSETHDEDKRLLYKQLQQRVELVALTIRRQEFLNENSVTMPEVEDYMPNPPFVSLEFVAHDEFYEANTNLNGAVNDLFFPEAARVVKEKSRELESASSRTRFGGASRGEADMEEDDDTEDTDKKFQDAIAADDGKFRGKDLALASMDYFRWLRGDSGASTSLGGNRFLHESMGGFGGGMSM
jgi:tetratricopeptide (TPR) repeat protein